MRMQFVLLMLQVAFAAALSWSCLCRLVKTDAETQREVRWAILLELIAAGFVGMAPLLPYLMPNDIPWAPLTTPGWVWLGLLIAATLMQLVTARYWHVGVPRQFQRTTNTGWAFAIVMAAAVFGGWQPAAHAVAEPTAPEVKVVPFARFAAGQSVDCEDPEGCVGMTGQAYEQLMQAAYDKGRASCGKRP